MLAPRVGRRPCAALPFAPQAQHSAQEVLTANVIDPCSAQNDVRTSAGDDRLVALQLGLAINAQRAGGVFLFVGTGLAAIVDVIGGVVDQQRTAAGAFLRDSRRSRGVDRARQLWLALGLVYGRVSSGVTMMSGANWRTERATASRSVRST